MLSTKIRGVVPPVSNLQVKIETRNIVERIAPKLIEVETRQRWWLEVEFILDLDMIVLEHVVAGSKIRFIEFQNAFYIEHLGMPDSLQFYEAYVTCLENLIHS